MVELNCPRILVVDDEETTQHELGLTALAATRARHPNEVEVSDLDWADLVLMDFFIDSWPERDSLDSVSLQPRNGLALAAVLREHADASNGDGHRYTAFAVHTAHIGDISQRLHTTNRTPDVVARLNNLEWAFDKADPLRFSQSATLASAVQRVSKTWSSINPMDIDTATAQLLRLSSDTAWFRRAADDVVLCQAPLSEFSSGTNGLLFLRWLLHGILPYPTFLLAKHWVAARLRITPESLGQVLMGDSQLARDMNDCLYSGILDSFCGPRWWRAAIDQYTWDVRASGAREPEEFHAVLEQRAGKKLERVIEISPVVCVARELKPHDTLRSLEDVVRLVPDLWPAYADPAYAELNCVREDTELRSIVHPLDRDRVAVAGEEE